MHTISYISSSSGFSINSDRLQRIKRHASLILSVDYVHIYDSTFLPFPSSGHFSMNKKIEI